MNYDVIIIHPPAVFDFRKKSIFPGALGSSVEQVQFNKVPIGQLSLAEYLDRHGYKVYVDNLGDRMVQDRMFDAEDHLRGLSAKIYAVGLSFQQHAQGAIETARLLKKYHPNALIVMGGLTATRFHDEIIKKYQFVDAVIRAEAEKPLLQFVRQIEQTGKIGPTPNLTYRDEDGKIQVTPLLPQSPDLDDYEYTRFDLIEPKTSIYPPGAPARWSLEVCRGCIFNCTICGGSAYTYKTHFGMKRPAFRSPAKIVADMRYMIENGCKFIGLYQDPRMGGRKYWETLIETIKNAKLDFERLSLDMLAPANEEFIRAIASLGKNTIIHICPDTGSEAVRRKLGRYYSGEQLLNTVKTCHKYHIPVTTFFSAGLAGENSDNINETWKLWEQLTELDIEAIKNQRFGSVESGVPIGGPIIGPILLDPGSLAFDHPQKYGYKLLYKNLEEYIKALSQPSWHQWLNYETDELNKEQILELIFSSNDFAINQRQRMGLYDGSAAESERLRLEADRIVVTEVDKILSQKNEKKHGKKLKELRTYLDNFLSATQPRNIADEF